MPRPGLYVATIRLGLAVLIAASVCRAVVTCATVGPMGSRFGTHPTSDYIQFHAAGRLQDEYGLARLYDVDLQDRVIRRLFPTIPAGGHLAVAAPPWLAAIFHPLSRLPIGGSFAAWMILSVFIYMVAIAVTLRSLGPPPGLDVPTTWLAALAFEPFAVECVLGGQLSILGALVLALTLAADRDGRPILAGACLSLLSYKPSLLPLLVLSALAGRRWRLLGGFALGLAALALLSLAAAGWDGCLGYLRLLARYGRAGGSSSAAFQAQKYVDLGAWLRSLGLPPRYAPLVGLPALLLVLAAWSRSARGPGPARDQAWASAMILCPILTPYGPTYDVTAAAPGLLCALWGSRRLTTSTVSRLILVLAGGIFVSGWASFVLANLDIPFQVQTPFLMATGMLVASRTIPYEL